MANLKTEQPILESYPNLYHLITNSSVSSKHQENMSVLVHSMQEDTWKYLDDFYILGNMFMYYNPVEIKHKKLRGPDFFLFNKMENIYDKKSWIVWDENWKYPDLIIDILSDNSNTYIDPKKELFQHIFRVKEYYVFDPYNQKFEGWKLNTNGLYDKLDKNEDGWIWSSILNSWIGLWEGEIKQKSDVWLRFYDIDRKLVLIPSEKEQLERELFTNTLQELEIFSKENLNN